MTFDDILDQTIEMLQRRGRLTYRTLKRQFQLDDAALEDLTFELTEGQRIAAVTHYQQALALANELGMPPLQVHCHRGLGTLYSQTGQLEQSRAELSTAIGMYRDMEMTFWLPETGAALAAVEGR